MFRKMLRPKQQLSTDECIDILKKEPRGVLSVLGDDDYPYGLPIDYWYCEDEGKLYFHCGKKGHKIDAITKHEKVSFCVYDQGYRNEGDWALYIRSVIIFGRAKIVDSPKKTIEITRQLSYKYTSDTEYIEDEVKKYGTSVLCIELTPEHISGKLVHEA